MILPCEIIWMIYHVETYQKVKEITTYKILMWNKYGILIYKYAFKTHFKAMRNLSMVSLKT